MNDLLVPSFFGFIVGGLTTGSGAPFVDPSIPAEISSVVVEETTEADPFDSKVEVG